MAKGSWGLRIIHLTLIVIMKENQSTYNISDFGSVIVSKIINITVVSLFVFI